MPVEPFDVDGRPSVGLELGLDVVDELLMAAQDADQRARTIEALVRAMCDMDALLDPDLRGDALENLRAAAARLVSDE